MDTKAGGYISEIKFNNGETLEINKNDIVIFVGPNNSGKSQSLKDIFELSNKKSKTIVVSSVKFEMSQVNIYDMLNSFLDGTEQSGYTSYNYLGNPISLFERDKNGIQQPYLGNLRNVFIANLNTTARLNICNPAPSINKNQTKSHPIHFAAFTSKYRKWLSDNFKKAFGIEIIPNILFGNSFPLCMSNPICFDGKHFKSEQDRLEAYSEILGKCEQVQNQGDGIKSFTGILLYLMLDNYRTYLIDEPESFLHPPQAKIMGEIIGNTLGEEQQAFISTHSDEIIKGLLEVCPERIKVVRITRIKNVNKISKLDNTEFCKIWNDPLLKYSNIMSGLFHKTVVLCESDSDCKMYSIIESHIKQEQGLFSETLFIHCGGKQRMAMVANALISLSIDVKLIPDLDVLNNEGILKEIIQTFSIDWNSIEKNYKIIVSDVKNQSEKVLRESVRTEIKLILDESDTAELTKKEITDIKSILSKSSKWDALKKNGETAFSSGDTTKAYNNLKKVLNEHNIFIVPVGELEGFIKEAGGHGPAWVDNVLSNYPDLNDPVYDKIKQFVASINL